MKRFALLIGLVLMVITSFGQHNKFRVTAFNHLKNGELDLAKEAIDKCITMDPIDDPKAWYYRGMIYYEISRSKEFSKLDANALEVSFESYIKGLLYNFEDVQYHKLNLDSAADAMKFFTALNNRSTKYKDSEVLGDILMNQMPNVANIYLGQGIKEFNESKNYDKAFEAFSKSLAISQMSGRLDTPVFSYAALAAEKCKKWDEAIQMYTILTAVGYGKNESEKSRMYSSLASCYKQKYVEKLDRYSVSYMDENNMVQKREVDNNWVYSFPAKKGFKPMLSAKLINGKTVTGEISGDGTVLKSVTTKPDSTVIILNAVLDKDLKVGYKVTNGKENDSTAFKKYYTTLQDGLKKYPNGEAVIIENINYYLQIGNYNKALASIDEAINKTANNPTLYFARGSIYDANFKQPDKATPDYLKAIELNPNYFDAYYNIGALYFNKGVELINNPETDPAKYEVLKNQGMESFKQAIPYLEKAHELNSRDIGTMDSLVKLYYRLQIMDKHDAMKKELQGLK